MRCLSAVLTLTLMGATLAMAAPAPLAVSPREAHDWLLHVIPLPREVQIQSKLTLPLDDVGVSMVEELAPPYVSLMQQMVAYLAQRGIQRPPGDGAPRPFTVLAGVMDPNGTLAGRLVGGADRIAALKQRDQAYVISRADDRTLIVTGLNPRGVYYGFLTLWQLVAPTLRQEGGRWVVDIPLAEIVDWPDLAERGEWGGSVNRDLEALAQHKLNLCESHCRSLQVTPEGKGIVEFQPGLIPRGAACATKVVPIITHLDQLQQTGLFKVLPETLGVGDPAKWPTGGEAVKPACFANPRTIQVLADWMVALARDPEVTDVSVWLSENAVSCQCPQCKPKGQFVLEAEAVARGYELARKVRPDIKLRVLLTQGSYKANDQVIASLPRDVGITYYDGGRTYDSSREPMIYPLLADYAKQGGWLGCYPQLTASWRIVCPWSGPQFIKARMTEFVDKGLACLCGYATPDNRFYDFNVTAAAEWSWNAHGRDEREFALAYFTQKGVKDPAQAADWAVLLGPVGWDVYGARVPYHWFFGSAAQSLKQGSLPPLGKGPFTYLPDEQHLAADLAACSQAMALATAVGDGALIAETAVIEGYLKMLRAMHELGVAIGRKKTLTDEEQAPVARAMGELDSATLQTANGLRAWQQSVAPDAAAGRFDDTVQMTEDTTAAIGEFVRTLGVDDPGRAYRIKRLGEWKTEDFAAAPETTKQWEVTDALSGEGTYRVKFTYRSGWNGLQMHRVTLLAAPRDTPADLKPVVTDQHEGVAAHKNVAHVYELKVPAPDPALRYYLSVSIRGVGPSVTPERRGCNGDVMFWKVRPQ